MWDFLKVYHMGIGTLRRRTSGIHPEISLFVSRIHSISHEELHYQDGSDGSGGCHEGLAEGRSKGRKEALTIF